MDLAVLASAVGPMLAREPLSIPKKLDPCAVDQQIEGPAALRLEISTVMVFCLRLRVEKSGTGQSRPAICRMLDTIPVVCRSGRPKSTFTIKQNWIAASENTGGLPIRPAFGASHTMSLSSQTKSDPRRFSASL